MIPVSALYDEYIDRPKLTEQKKPFEYIVPPPSPQEGRNIYWNNRLRNSMGKFDLNSDD